MVFYIYIKTPPYLADFIRDSFGHPAILPKNSPEHRIIRHFITRTPADCRPDLAKDGNVTICIPVFRERDPRVYNYMGRHAKNYLIESFESLFDKCLISEVASLENLRNNKISSAIYAFMEKHNIDLSTVNTETVLQRYYRIRKRYQKHNINLN
jgi:hypothetical protein